MVSFRVRGLRAMQSAGVGLVYSRSPVPRRVVRWVERRSDGTTGSWACATAHLPTHSWRNVAHSSGAIDPRGTTQNSIAGRTEPQQVGEQECDTDHEYSA